MSGARGLGLEAARRRDAANPMTPFSLRFVPIDPTVIYLDGNSLGRLPLAALERMRTVVETEWGRRLIGSWGAGWFDAAVRLGDKVAPLVGAGVGQVVYADSTSVSLYKLAVAALDHRSSRGTIVTDALNFPSDLYVLQGITRERPQVRLRVIEGAPDGVHGDEEALLTAIDDDTALVVLSHVTFKSGFQYDAERITHHAHASGALVLWDLSHSVGSVPVALDAWGADLAVGCGYKYLNGGQGAPAFLYVRRDLQPLLRSPIWGWFAQERPFAFEREHQPVAGIRRFTVGTPPILSLLAVEPGLDLMLEAGMARVREASVALSDYLIELVDARLAPLGFRVATPRASVVRGSHVSLAHEDAYRISRAMVAANVIPDFREPDGIRLGLAPLYVGFEDLFHAVDRIAEIVTTNAHHAFTDERTVIT